MRQALTADKNSLTEDTIDLLRAFSFLIHYLPLEEIKQKVSKFKYVILLEEWGGDYCYQRSRYNTRALSEAL